MRVDVVYLSVTTFDWVISVVSTIDDDDVSRTISGDDVVVPLYKKRYALDGTKYFVNVSNNVFPTCDVGVPIVLVQSLRAIPLTRPSTPTYEYNAPVSLVNTVSPHTLFWETSAMKLHVASNPVDGE